MSDNSNTMAGSEFLEHTGLNCYLSAILAISNCMAEVCPSVGLAYRNRWQRMPQRIAFDSSQSSLEVSLRTIETDLEMFSGLAGRYYRACLPLIVQAAAAGTGIADAALDRITTQAVLMETLAGELETAAEMDAPPDLRQVLELQSAGLRAGAKRAGQELIPVIAQLRALIHECERLVKATTDLLTVDAETGFCNARGFRQEVEARKEEARPFCILNLECTAHDQSGADCSPEEFSRIVVDLTSRISDQFRPNDAIARLGPRRFCVLFDGEWEQAAGRVESMTRCIAGRYPHGDGHLTVAVSINVHDAVKDAQHLDAVLETSDPLPEFADEISVATDLRRLQAATEQPSEGAVRIV